MKHRTGVLASLLVVSLSLALVPNVFAATTADSELTQTILAGALSTSILDSSGVPVTSPSFPMSAITSSMTSVQTSTGTFGTDTQRITVDNPSAATSGWTLALAGAASAAWTGGAGSYPYNSSTSDGGQLSVTSAGTVVPVAGGSTGVTGAVPGTFSDTVSSITIMSAGSSSSSSWNGYITGIGLSQTVPAGTPAGAYSLDLVQTVTAS